MLTQQASNVRTGLVRLKSGRADETRSEQLADRARVVTAAVKELEGPTSYIAIATARRIPVDSGLGARAHDAAEAAANAIQALMEDDTGEAVLGEALGRALALTKEAAAARDQAACDSWEKYANYDRWVAHQGVMATLARIGAIDSQVVLIARRLHELSTQLVDAGALRYPKRIDQVEAFDNAIDEFERLFATIGGDEAVPPHVLSFIQDASGQGADLEASLTAIDWLRQHDLQRRFVVRLAQ